MKINIDPIEATPNASVKEKITKTKHQITIYKLKHVAKTEAIKENHIGNPKAIKTICVGVYFDLIFISGSFEASTKISLTTSSVFPI